MNIRSRTGSGGEESIPRQVLLESDSYGTHNPLDWNTMPLSLRERFPHWKDQKFPSPDIKRKDTDKEGHMMDGWAIKCVDGWTIKCVDGWAIKCVDGWTNR